LKVGVWRGVIGFFILSVFIACASFQVKKKESFQYKNVSFEAVWAAASKALQEMDFEIKETKKEKIGLPAYSEWTGYILAEGKRNFLTQVAAPQMRITIKRQGGRVEVTCEAIQPKQVVDYGGTRKNIDRFYHLLNKNLPK